MDKIGIPRGLFYYYYKDIWVNFFDELNISYFISPNTNKEIMDRGIKVSADEMCLSFKIFLGHVDYLKDKCNYLLVPRVSNYGSNNQTCTNFWAAYDVVNNLFDKKIIDYNIDLEHGETLKRGLYKIGKMFGKSNIEIKKAYYKALYSYDLIRKKNIEINLNKLKSNRLKILIVSHPYNTYDSMIGLEIVKYLNKNDVEIIYSDKFDEMSSRLYKKISSDLYFKYNKDNVGAIVRSMSKIDGIIFISSFPCGPDSLVNELVIRKIKIPNINLIMDGNLSFEGIETRLESFLDVLRGNAYV